MERQRLALVLDPRGFVQSTRQTGDRDHPSGEEALVELPVHTEAADGGVPAHAAPHAHGQRLAQLGLVESVGGTFCGSDETVPGERPRSEACGASW